MILVLDDLISLELKEYLLTQDGINDVECNDNSFLTEVKIDYNELITPEIIFKYIKLFQNKKYSILVEFDKGIKGKFNTLKYIVDDMCCEYCYKGFVEDLFENENIKSIKSNFDFNKPAFNIEFIIEYNNNYSEKKLNTYIEDKLMS